MRILGINDEVTTCECCGRTDLKCTVVLTDDEGMSELRFGRQCAAKALRPRHPIGTAKIETYARQAQFKREQEERQGRKFAGIKY